MAISGEKFRLFNKTKYVSNCLLVGFSKPSKETGTLYIESSIEYTKYSLNIPSYKSLKSFNGKMNLLHSIKSQRQLDIDYGF